MLLPKNTARVGESITMEGANTMYLQHVNLDISTMKSVNSGVVVTGIIRVLEVGVVGGGLPRGNGFFMPIG